MNENQSGDPWYEIIQQVIATGSVPDPWPVGTPDAQVWRGLAEELILLQNFAMALSVGDLSHSIASKGQLAGSLKALQAGLRHLTGQVQQVADGDLNLRVDFMGDFSSAFNKMTESLSRARLELSASEERYRRLMDASPDAVIVSDLEGVVNFVSMSKPWTDRQIRAEDILGHNLMEWIRPHDRARITERMARLLAGEELGSSDYTLIHPDGNQFPSEIFSSTLCDASGTTVGLISIIRDISDRVRREKELREQTALAEALRDSAAALNSALSLEQVLDVILNSLCSVVLHDAADILLVDDSQVCHCVRFSSYERMTAEQDAEMERKEYVLADFANLRRMSVTRQPLIINDVSQYDWQTIPPTGWICSCLGVPILTEGKVAGFIGLYAEEVDFFAPEHAARLTVFADQAAVAIEKAHLFEELRRLAAVDALTGIANRRHFFVQAELEFARAARYGQKLTAMMLDIDHFKGINDTYGHAVGDQVLTTVAQICARSLRKIDLLGRYGGEEFVFLLPETDGEEACAAAERLRQGIADAVLMTGEVQIQLTVSIGIATLDPREDRLDALLNRADLALLRAKQAGRNRVEYSAL